MLIASSLSKCSTKSPLIDTADSGIPKKTGACILRQFPCGQTQCLAHGSKLLSQLEFDCFTLGQCSSLWSFLENSRWISIPEASNCEPTSVFCFLTKHQTFSQPLHPHYLLPLSQVTKSLKRSSLASSPFCLATEGKYFNNMLYI